MNFLQLYGEGLDRELGSADSDQLFTTVRRKAAVNSAQLEFNKQTECFVRQGILTMVDDTANYDLETSGVISAQDFLWIAAQGAEYVYQNAAAQTTYLADKNFPRVDVPVLNREYPGWRLATKTSLPSSYHLFDDGGIQYFGLYPPPAVAVGESGRVFLPYVAKPVDMVGDSDEPYSVSTNPLSAIVPWHQALVHYAAALLEPLRKGYQAEQRQRGLFAGLVADYLQRQRPKGGQSIVAGRNYYREARRFSGVRIPDPRIWP